MSLANKKNKDGAMASALKAAGIERTATKGHQRCPICNHTVNNAAFYNHIASHK